MLKLDQKADVLMKYFRENKSQREIAREMKLSRTTIRKYINEYESKSEEIEELAKLNETIPQNDTLKLVAELVSAPKYDTSSRARVKLTDEVIEKIEELINENEKNRLLGRSKQLMKKIDIHEKIVSLGFDISYSTICNYLRETMIRKKLLSGRNTILEKL